MSNDLAIYFSRQLLWHALLIAAPVVLAALLCGLCTSILQAATQINDSTLGFIPKMLAVILVLMTSAGWMLHALIAFAEHIFSNIPRIVS
jgi:flagellar biosynthetic protein FliQ